MRHIIIRVSAVLALLGGAGLSWAVSTGPPISRTGAFPIRNKPVEPTCHVCHGLDNANNPPLNDPSGSLQILNVPAHYTPGATYQLTVRLQHTWDPMPPDPLRWGFQMQAVTSFVGDSAGTWVLSPNAPPDSFKIMRYSSGSSSLLKRRVYVEQAGFNYLSQNPPMDWAGGPTHYGELGPVEWHVNWQAPPGDSGKIYFFAAGNSGNGDYGSLGSNDFIYTTVESSTVMTSVDVPTPREPFQAVNSLERPYPNPMVKCTSLDFTISRSGVVDVSVFDLQGRRVRTILHGHRDAGYHAWYWDGKRDDGTYVKNGLYFIRMLPPGERKPISQKVTMAR